MIRIHLNEYYNDEVEKQYGDEPGLDASNQEFTSADTSINSSKLPTLFSKVKFKPNTVNLDIGGGKFDNVAQALAEKDVINYVYDPFNRTSQHNTEVIKAIRKNGGADTVTCSNVLNVIKEPEARMQVIKNCDRFLKPGGTAYFTVYVGNKSGNGKMSKKNCYQLNQPTKWYMDEIQQVFNDVSCKNDVITAK